MIYLLLCILCTTSLIFIFKVYEQFKVHTFQAIVINYLTCIVIGILMPDNKFDFSSDILTQPWLYTAMLLGSIFIGTFYLIALTTQQVGITAASVATKISLVIPVLFSLLVLQNNLKDYTLLNYAGMAVALVAIVLASVRPQEHASPTASGVLVMLLPFIVFLNSGIADVIINYTNHHFLKPDEAGLFTMLTFTTSAVIGSLVLLYQIIFNKVPFAIRSILAGVLLGIPNYFSIYFLIKALSAFENDGAFLFPVNNIGIILAGAAGAVLIFNEKLSKTNVAGIGLAVLALALISYQEILTYLF
ncbi:MAG: hypothetical protein LPJ89_04725 [Hymenobacteraceae bacterium]|nr:hypothetical protein [Hymenobacteraceae bacterium]MDX5397785.1 hypothetical protein [Hymenobacteraceae bacterium]MDX5443071.1 hypothetical protein [Hymenobacteraceae bacterium]MDX5513861.1 hypothetical protein [Hymenobacteraceae bacterium]